LIARHGLGAVADGDPALLCDRLIGLLEESPVTSAARRAAVRTFARAEFDPERTLDALDALLHDAAARE
jgi:hypothetical protein